MATPNVDCLKFGGAYCKLNYEADKTHSIDIQVTDDGSPPLSSNFQLTITLNNINDQPRSLAMNNTVVSNLQVAKAKGFTIISRVLTGFTGEATATAGDPEVPLHWYLRHSTIFSRHLTCDIERLQRGDD